MDCQALFNICKKTCVNFPKDKNKKSSVEKLDCLFYKAIYRKICEGDTPSSPICIPNTGYVIG